MATRFPDPLFVAYPTKGIASLGLTGVTSMQTNIFNIRATNNSGSGINVGLMRSFVASRYNIYTYVNSTTTYTNVSASLAAGGPVNLFTGTINDGFVFQSYRKTAMLGLTISTGQTGGTFTYKYWNGSAFVTLPTMEVPVYTTTGVIYIVAMPPPDWVKGGPAGLDPTEYSLQVISSAAPAGAVAITSLFAAEFMEFLQGVPNNAMVQLSFPDSKPMLLNGGETIFPYFSTAAATNSFGAYYAVS